MTHLADYVNPYIGTISHMLTSTRPEVLLPYGMARSAPVVRDCGDYYCNDRVVGFPLGEGVVTPGKGDDFTNYLDHSREESRCYVHRLELDPYGILAESTVTAHCCLHRFQGQDRLRLAFPQGKVWREGELFFAQLPLQGTLRPVTQFLCVSVEGPYQVVSQGEGEVTLAVGESVTVAGALSLISPERARESLLEEAAGKSFDALWEQARQIWDRQLGKVLVTGNTQEKKTVFYTGLYRAFQRMTDYTEGDAHYSGFDGKVHKGVFYSNDGLWDSFRCMHPLQLLLDPARHREILQSYVEMTRESGLMPCFPGVEGDRPFMIGFHGASLFADALAKGVEADYAAAYEGIRKNALEQSMLPWRCGLPAGEKERCYWEKGYYPALQRGEPENDPQADPFERRQAVAVTLEHCYDDWCAGKLAEHLGRGEEAALFYRRAQGYRSLYREDLGWMAPRAIDGAWVEGFDPKFGGGLGGRDYTAENNTWTYTWSVFHDPEGLAELMGGKEKAVEKLDQLFREGFHQAGKSKYLFLGQFPDSTGLMGQFSMGNEPSFHIPYLYDYYGAPWKTQRRLRELMDLWFTDSPTGICGDEDGGAMSSWLVFSALGFYPVCPGKPEYALGTPLFDEAQLLLDNGKVFRVVSQGAGEGARYIQAASLNGKPLETPFLRHQDLIQGGELVLTMGRRPNTGWGVG